MSAMLGMKMKDYTLRTRHCPLIGAIECSGAETTEPLCMEGDYSLSAILDFPSKGPEKYAYFREVI